jgi:gliding motility-associated-like protein
VDSDNDGSPNFVDFDSDADGVSDLEETINDFDSDGIPNYLDLDSDSDEVQDFVEGNQDKDKNGFKDFLDPQTFVPEIFTPNADGVNDFFEIKGLINYPNAQLTIFNQWGVTVYKSNGPYDNQWGGWNAEERYTGQRVILPEGIYFYVLDHNRSDLPQYNKPQTKGNFYLKP